MNIVVINSAQKFIGEAAHCLDLTGELLARGHRALLVVKAGSALEERAAAQGVPLLGLHLEGGFHPLQDLRDLLRLRRVLSEFQADLIHCHRGKDHWLAVAALGWGRERLPLVRTRHVVMPVRNHFANRWLLRRRADAVIAVSRKAAESFGEMAPLLEGKMRVIYSSVDSSRFHPSRRSEPWRTELGVSDGHRLVGLIARYQRIKGQEVFIRAAALVLQRYPETWFLLAGRGTDTKLASYRKLAGELGIENRVIYRGWLDDIPQAMASLDVGVLASLGSEGSSRVTYEYQACAVPVVATTVGCIPEVVDAEQNGLTVPPGDPEAMAAAICRILDNPELAERLRAGGQERIESFFNRDRWMREILEVYEGVTR